MKIRLKELDFVQRQCEAVEDASKRCSEASPAHRQEHMKQRVPMHRTETFPPNEPFQHKTREGKTWLNGL